MAIQPVWICKRKQIYLNLGIINVLRATFFSSKTAIGSRHTSYMTSTHAIHEEPEMTIPLVALAATGVSIFLSFDVDLVA